MRKTLYQSASYLIAMIIAFLIAATGWYFYIDLLRSIAGLETGQAPKLEDAWFVFPSFFLFFAVWYALQERFTGYCDRCFQDDEDSY